MEESYVSDFIALSKELSDLIDRIEAFHHTYATIKFPRGQKYIDNANDRLLESAEWGRMYGDMLVEER